MPDEPIEPAAVLEIPPEEVPEEEIPAKPSKKKKDLPPRDYRPIDKMIEDLERESSGSGKSRRR